jgi:exosortase
VPEAHTGRLRLWLIAAGVLLVYAPTGVWLWKRWTLSVWNDAHGIFVLPLAAWLGWEALKYAGNREPEDQSAWGYAFVVPALLLHVLDAGIQTHLLSAFSLLLLLPGLSLLLLGPRRTRLIAFPLAFTLFALPIPLALTEHLHLILRQLTTVATAAIVPVIGIPVYAEETTLQLANSSLVIADACSGFSTLYAAVAMACLTAYFAPTSMRRTLVLLSAAPLAIAANILRIVLLVVIVSRTGIDVLSTWIHPASGMLTFALALPVIFWLGGSPAQAESKRPDGAPEAAA